MWLIIYLATRVSNCNIFLFSLYQGYPPQNSLLTVSIGNEKRLFLYFSRHVRSRHIVYGQDTWYMDIFYQVTLCRWTVLEVHTHG